MIRPLRQSTLMQTKMHLESPPYRKVRALRLFDTPATPKTIIQKSSVENRPVVTTPAMQSKFIRKPILSNTVVPKTPNIHERPKAFPVHCKTFEPVTANINPFSPSSM